MGGRPLGQHFLTDPAVIERILNEASPPAGQRVLEIGPGRGALTYPLVLGGARVVAVETDERLAGKLKTPAHSPGDLKVVVQDFLQLDLHQALEGQGWWVIANLPYYITTPILEKLLQQNQGKFEHMWLMMQHEVADRIVSPATRQSGSLTHFVGFYAEANYVFAIPPAAFDPPPKVESAVVHFRFRPPPDDCNPRRFFQILRQAFAQRRKMLRTSLKGLLSPEHFQQARVDPGARPETLTLEDFLRLERSSRQG